MTRSKGFYPMMIRFLTQSTYNHAGIYTGKGKVIEARPSGAGYADVAEYLGENTLWSHGKFVPIPFEGLHRREIVDEATKLIGTPYGWLDLMVIGLAQTRLGRRIDPTLTYSRQPWWARRIMNPRRLVCSQLVDLAYWRADIHLFADHRLPLCVAPSDLAQLLKGGNDK